MFVHPTKHLCCPQYTDLKAIQVLGAGVDSLVTDPDLPRNIPLLRVIDPLMTERMATWIMWAVINAQVWCCGGM
jgi:glyoxylate/hydroxypyruvate reductase A